METLSTKSVSLHVLQGDTRRQLKAPPDLNVGFSELQEVLFCIPSIEDCRLLVDDAPLTAGVAGDWTSWAWKPGFYAGEVRVELMGSDGQCLGCWPLDISPDANKLGRDRFSAMLADVLQFDPSLVIGQEPARLRVGALGRSQDPLVALARLRARGAALRQSLRAIVREPTRALRSRRSLVPLHQVRRVDRQTAVAALSQPVLLAAMGRLENLQVAGYISDLRANVPDVERHFDSPANRCLLAMLRALLRRCVDISERLRKEVEFEKRSDTVTPLADRWPTWARYLNDMHEDLLATSGGRPFSEVRRAEITAAGLNAVSAHPLYSRFWRLAWQALRNGVEGLAQEELLPMNPTWELYERWCFVELCRQLQAALPNLTWERLASRSLKGKDSTGLRVRLDLQPTFASTSGESRGGFWSISGRRVPDIVLSWKSPEETAFVVLDAKYRVARENVLDAMSSAHIYQDSLRMGGQRAVCSILLVPASGGARWLEDAEFIAEHKVGIAALQPGGKLPEWLSSALARCMPGP